MYAYLYVEEGYVFCRVSYPEWSMYSTLYPTDEQVDQAIQRVRKDFPVHSFSLMRRDYLFETERVVAFVEKGETAKDRNVRIEDGRKWIEQCS